MVAFGLVVSGMTQIILPYINVFLNAWSATFKDKINQTLQFLAIGIVIIYGGLYLAMVESDTKMRKNKSDSQLSQNHTKNKKNV